MTEKQSRYAVNTGSSTTKPAKEASFAIVTKDGETQTEAKEDGTPQATTPKRRNNTKNGKQETPPSAPLMIPKYISNLIKPFFNDATEIYIAPDTMIALITERTEIRRDTGCWILFRLPPIQTDPAPEEGLAYQIKPKPAP